MAERGPTAMLHRIYTCVAQRVIRVWIGPGARDLESTVAHGFVKHDFKVLLHCVVEGPLQASHCLVLQSLNETPLVDSTGSPLQVSKVDRAVRVNSRLALLFVKQRNGMICR